MSKVVGTLIVVVGLVLVFLGTQGAKDRRQSTFDVIAKLSEVPERLDPLISLGHVGAIHSFLQLWLVQHFDLDVIQDSGSKIDVLGNITQKKPNFESFYVMTCHAYLKSRLPENCEKVSDTGLSLFPTSYPISMTQTYVELAFFQNVKNAARFLKVASTSKDPPEFVDKLLKKITRSPKKSEKKVELH